MCVRPFLVLAVLFSSVTFSFFRVGLRLQESNPNIVGPDAGVEKIGKRQTKALLVSHTCTRVIS